MPRQWWSLAEPDHQLRESLGMGIPDQAGKVGKETFLKVGRCPVMLRSICALDGVQPGERRSLFKGMLQVRHKLCADKIVIGAHGQGFVDPGCGIGSLAISGPAVSGKEALKGRVSNWISRKCVRSTVPVEFKWIGN